MNFCFFGYDHSLDVLIRLIKDGHKAMQVYTFKCDNVYAHNNEIKAFCEKENIPITQGKISADNVQDLISRGCELFLASGYLYKIPSIDKKSAYGINIHPTLLPRARGIMPQPYIIMNEPEAAGFTLHKLTQEYDAGDILLQKAIPIDNTTDIETLAARIAVHTPGVVSKVIADIESYWTNAAPQDHDRSSFYKEPDATFRSLNWNDDIETLLRTGRAFGRFGVFARITNQFDESQKLAVYQFNGWAEKHDHTPGTLIRSLPGEITIAVQDGYLCLQDFMPIK